MTFLNVLSPQIKASEAMSRVMDVDRVPAAVAGLTSSDAAMVLAKNNPRMAVRLIAGWLSTRECIWWAGLCMAQLRKAGADVGAPDLLHKIVRWVTHPLPETMKPLENAGESLRSGPIGLLASGVLLTRENISPSKNHPVAPVAGLANRMAAMSILGGAGRWPADNRKACLDHMVNLGLDVAECLHQWDEKAVAAHPGLRTVSSRAFLTSSGNIWENWK